MTLILTTTCSYALLIAIDQGTGFPSFNDRDIFLHSRLALHLPDTIGDLIPPSTIISAKPTKLVPKPQWRTTLGYFLSAKLLKRLKRRCAVITLQVTTMTGQGDMHELGTVTLRVDQAKTIKVTQRRQQQQQQPPFNILKDYVIDKGDWKPVIKNGNGTTMNNAQIKVGLFVVEMPLHAGERNRETTAASVRHHAIFNKQSEDSSYGDLGLEIHSMDTNDEMTNSLLSLTGTDGSNDYDTDQSTMNQHHHVTSSSSLSSSSDLRTSSNKKEKIISNTSTASLPIMDCFRVIQHKHGPFPYLQIGNGSQRYTFVLRLVEATAVMSLLSTNDPLLTINKSSSNIRKLMQYTFSDWQVKHDVITKGHSWQVTDQPMCLFLQGHLHDLQQWLSQQGQIEVCLVLADMNAKCEHTIGKSMVRLKGWCPLRIEQASFPIHDRSNRLHVDQPFQFARVVVQLGLTEGWGNGLDGQQRDIHLANNSSNSNDSDSRLVQPKHTFLHQQNLIK
ncbi:hypothetical protein BCR42DRAFT_414706 [Absidia repens]|uniref:Uncharacterized protein n=1 Tax=Absidia repens TaxID=90262 RepID=A0A1X2IGJ9_9FUNG|nr:hypothetical protein BCR42DRAFT_414706 [Absidia repens]